MCRVVRLKDVGAAGEVAMAVPMEAAKAMDGVFNTACDREEGEEREDEESEGSGEYEYRFTGFASGGDDSS